MDEIEKINKNTDPDSEDVAIIEGDIRLPPVESASASNEYSNAVRQKFRLWPGGVVPYVIDNNIANRTKHMEALRKAIEIWENNTCVRFIPRTNQYRYAYIYYGPKGCNSNVGALWSKPSKVSLGSRCYLASIATHELGHLLGFGHEQNRPDRDQYIDILWENIDTAKHRIFRKSRHWFFQSLGVPYDYSSIMHYSRYQYSKNGEPTMVSRDPNIQRFGGLIPSKLDIKQMNLLYSCSEIPLFPKHFSLRSTSSPYLNCIAMNQSQDTEWGVKYLCYRTSMKKLHLSWSSNGPIGGQDCINTAMPYERTAKLWNNSFLCLPRDSLLKLRWSVSGELKGWGCLFMRNGQHARTRYLLCGKTKYEKSDGGWSKWSSFGPCNKKCGGGFRTRVRSCDSPTPKYGGDPCKGNYYETISCNTNRCLGFPSWPRDFTFMFISFTPRRKMCIPIYERYQYIYWAKAKLCWASTKRYIDVRWSDKGPVEDMRCTQIKQQSGKYQTGGWENNYLCIRNAPYNFRWSTNGPIKGLACIRWQNNAFAHRNLWQNNYLCAEEYPRPTRSLSTGCYPGWRSFIVNSVPYCYLSFRNKHRTWDEARKFCEEKKATLASINSKREQDFVKQIIADSVWIGLSNKQEWEWTDGSSVTYVNWSAGEPNNGGTSNVTEECVVNISFSGKWNDFPCDTKFNFICKMKAVL